MTTTIDFDKLAKDIKDGLAIACAVAANTNDGGSCNFDAPAFRFDRSPSKKVREQYEAAVGAAGLSGFWCDGVFSRGKNRRFVFGPGCGGQGLSRTRAAEAIQKHLESCGWSNVGVYYQAD